jgi:hypothetical protein
MKLTRREKHVLIAAAVIALFFIIARPSEQTVDDWELFYLFFVVAPLGFYIALDPERIKEG